MTIVLEPELENELRRKAAEKGQEADAYLHLLVEAGLRQPVPPIIRSSLAREEIQRLRQESLARAVARDLPVSASDFRREDIYDDAESE